LDGESDAALLDYAFPGVVEVGADMGAGFEAAASAGLDHGVVVVGVVAADVEREGLVAQFGERDGAAVGHVVGGGDGEDDGLVLETLVFEVVGDSGAERDGQIEPSVANVGNQLSGRVLAGVQVQRGVPFGECGEQRCESVARGRRQPEP
jgi:hypothetical protein